MGHSIYKHLFLPTNRWRDETPNQEEKEEEAVEEEKKNRVNIYSYNLKLLTPELNPPPSRHLMAVRLFKGLTARHIYVVWRLRVNGNNMCDL